MEDSADVESTNEEKNVSSLKLRKRKTEEAEQNILEDIEFCLQHEKIKKLYEESSQKLYERSRKKEVECREKMLKNGHECLSKIEHLLLEFIHQTVADKFTSLSRTTWTKNYEQLITSFQEDEDEKINKLATIINDCEFAEIDISTSTDNSADLYDFEDDGNLNMTGYHIENTEYVFDMTARITGVLVENVLFPADKNEVEYGIIEMVVRYADIKGVI